jgi:RNA-directed DNA polymerase
MKNKSQLIYRIASEDILEQAYQAVCKSRKNSSHNNGIWDVRFNWSKYKIKLKKMLLDGSYHLSPLCRYDIDEQQIDCWEAQDAIVLKAVAIVLSRVLETQIPICCTHIKGHGGGKKAVIEVQKKIKEYKFVYKSDIKSFYQSIDHNMLMNQLKKKITCKITLRLIYEYCNRLVDINGKYPLIDKGISMGCPLSPLFGAWFLRELDLKMSEQPVFYRRFMDDWVVLAKTRNHLRKAIKTTEKILTKLELKKHPDKTFIGRIKKGFDFLGFRLSIKGLRVSNKTLERCKAKIDQLYEQGANANRIGTYWRHWLKWCKSVVKVTSFRFLKAQIIKFALKIMRLKNTKNLLILEVKFGFILKVGNECPYLLNGSFL